MRAVFDHSWGLLTAEEQAIFRRLALFYGGFTRPAAEQVAGATLASLSNLVDKSLVRWEPEGSGRYHLHALLRQYALDHWAQEGEAAETAARRQHAAYFAHWLHQTTPHLMGGRQIETLHHIQADLDNLRAAWWFGVAQQEAALLEQLSHPLSNYFQYSGRYQEPAEAVGQGLAVLMAAPPTPARFEHMAMMHLELAWLNVRFGLISKATYHATQSQKWLTQHDRQPPLGIATDPRLALALIHTIRTDYEEARQLYEAVYVQSMAQGQWSNQQYACHGLASVAVEVGDWATAAQFAQQGVALAEAHGEFWLRAYLLNQLGQVAQQRGDWQGAEGYFQQSYDIRAQFNDHEGMGVALTHVGHVYLAQGDVEAAERAFGQSAALYRESTDRGGLATAVAGLGQAALTRKAWAEAGVHLAEALQVAVAIEYLALWQTLLPLMGQVLQGAGVVAVVPLETLKPTEATAVAALAHQLRHLPHTGAGREPSAPPTPTQVGNTVLVEPLTERELEVLRLIAAGQSNQAVAQTLFLSLGTVKWYTGQIYGKLGVSSRTQAIGRAQELGLL